MRLAALIALAVLLAGCPARIHNEEDALLAFTIASMYEVDVDAECRKKADREVLAAHHQAVATGLEELRRSLNQGTWWSVLWGSFADGFLGSASPHGSAPQEGG